MSQIATMIGKSLKSHEVLLIGAGGKFARCCAMINSSDPLPQGACVRVGEVYFFSNSGFWEHSLKYRMEKCEIKRDQERKRLEKEQAKISYILDVENENVSIGRRLKVWFADSRKRWVDPG